MPCCQEYSGQARRRDGRCRHAAAPKRWYRTGSTGSSVRCRGGGMARQEPAEPKGRGLGRSLALPITPPSQSLRPPLLTPPGRVGRAETADAAGVLLGEEALVLAGS